MKKFLLLSTACLAAASMATSMYAANSFNKFLPTNYSRLQNPKTTLVRLAKYTDFSGTWGNPVCVNIVGDTELSNEPVTLINDETHLFSDGKNYLINNQPITEVDPDDSNHTTSYTLNWKNSTKSELLIKIVDNSLLGSTPLSVNVDMLIALISDTQLIVNTQGEVILGEDKPKNFKNICTYTKLA